MPNASTNVDALTSERLSRAGMGMPWVDGQGFAVLSGHKDIGHVEAHRLTLPGCAPIYGNDAAAIRAIADEVGARVLFDAAHLCGVIAGRACRSPWPTART